MTTFETVHKGNFCWKLLEVESAGKSARSYTPEAVCDNQISYLDESSTDFSEQKISFSANRLLQW